VCNIRKENSSEEEVSWHDKEGDESDAVIEDLEEAQMDLHTPFIPGTIHEESKIAFWMDTLKSSQWVMEVLTQGYVLPFEKFPDAKYEEQNNKSARKEMEFVRDTVRKWEQEGIVDFVQEKPEAVSPLTVVSRTLSDGSLKKRLCFDGSRFINLRLKKEKVNLAHLQTALEITEKGDWQAKYDLTNAYFHIKICPEHQKFLGASFDNENGSRQFFQFKVMPFGLATAVHAITKLMKPVQAFINLKGIRHSIYIDDGRVVAETKEKAQKNFGEVLKILAAAGWQIAKKKSDTLAEVSQRKEFLGFLINSKDMKVELLQEKKIQIRQVAKEVQSAAGRFLRVKDLASLVGKVVATEPALGSLIPIMTRRVYSEIDEAVNKAGWGSKIRISEEVSEDFKEIIQRLNEFDGTPIRTQATQMSVVSIIGEPSDFLKEKFLQNHRQSQETEIWVGDASASAVCAFSVTAKQPFFFKHDLSEDEKTKSSGMRELLTVKYLLKSIAEKAVSHDGYKTIYWLTDSENLVGFLNKGSGRKHIQEEVLAVIQLARCCKISIVPIHLRREDPRIQTADAGSKNKDSDDWSIDNDTVMRLQSKYGRFTVDLFANEVNCKFTKFYSNYYSPKSAGVEAFSQDWTGEFAWVCPPVKLIIRVIRKIKAEKLSGILIVPSWTSARFWPFVFGEDRQLLWPFKEVEKIRPIIQQLSGAETGLKGLPRFDLLALFFDSN
jgi:hypothetical protein